MVVVTGSNIHTETWRIVQTLISGNVSDPILSTRAQNQVGSTWIFAAFPDLEARNRPRFPVIVIDNPTTDRSPQTFSYGNIENGITLSVNAYSLSNQQVNEITDDIQDALLQSRQSILGSNLSLVSVSDGANGTDIINNQRLHFKQTQASFRLISTSA